jgi:hypothetical protein
MWTVYSHVVWPVMCIVLHVIMFARNVDGATGKQVKELYTKLLDVDYDVKLRPVLNQADPVRISTQFHLQEVMDFSEIKRTITVRGWFDMTWTDEYLVWNASDHGDTRRLVVPPNKVWIPQIALKNSASKTTDLGHDTNSLFSVRVQSNGSLVWQPGTVFETFCKVSIRQYPFDIQKCQLSFVVWNYPVSDVELVPKAQPNTFRFFSLNPEWSVTDVDISAMSSMSSLLPGDDTGTVGEPDDTLASNPDNFSTFVINIRMVRRPRFILTTTIAPIIMVAFLNPCVFLIPSKSGEKTPFILTLFLSFGVYMTVISSTLPSTADEESLLASYVVTVLMLCVIMAFW